MADHVAARVVIFGVLSCIAAGIAAQESKTILGPSNSALQDGANELKSGRAEEGVRLTLLGLERALTPHERKIARANLCAGYALLGQYELALDNCNAVLAEDDRDWRSYSNRALVLIKLQRLSEAEQDLLKGEAIAPHARTIKAVRKMYLDAVNPVSPSIVIDDRTAPPDD